MSEPLDLSRVLDQNPGVQVERVAEFLAFREKLEEQGVDMRPRYRVTLPLGGIESPGHAVTAAPTVQSRPQR